MVRLGNVGIYKNYDIPWFFRCIPEIQSYLSTLGIPWTYKYTNKVKAISAELLKLNFKNKLEETGKTR